MTTAPKAVRAVALMVALAGLSASALSVSHAQTKDKETAKKTAKKGGKVVIREGKNGKFYFSIYNADDKYVAGSGAVGHKTAKDAEKALDELKDVLTSAKIEMGKKKETDEDDDESKGKKGKKEMKDKDGQ